jgi:hypothetical protein
MTMDCPWRFPYQEPVVFPEISELFDRANQTDSPTNQ